MVLDLNVGLQADYGVEMARQLRADGQYVPILLKPFSVEDLGQSLARPLDLQ